DIEQIYDLIDKTFGHNFITINDQSDFNLKNNHDSYTLVIKEFVQKKWDINFYLTFNNRHDQIIFFITQYEVNDWRKNFGPLYYRNNEKIFKEKITWRIEQSILLNLKNMQDSEIETILELKFNKLLNKTISN
ncbi:9886_t:CDS:1, partial [Cetraspora pellucida]